MSTVTELFGYQRYTLKIWRKGRMIIDNIEGHIIDILEKHGWQKGRKYNADFWISELEEEGYKINDYAYSILLELGNIEIRENSTEICTAVTLDFNPYYSASGEFDRVEEFENVCGETIFPIGALQDYIVYAGNSKRIYLGDWEGMYLAGNSIEEYLNNMFKKGYEPTKISLKR